jgi:hypothetical protein
MRLLTQGEGACDALAGPLTGSATASCWIAPESGMEPWLLTATNGREPRQTESAIALTTQFKSRLKAPLTHDPTAFLYAPASATKSCLSSISITITINYQNLKFGSGSGPGPVL